MVRDCKGTATPMLNNLLPPPWIITCIMLDYNHDRWEVTAWDELWTGNAVMVYGPTIESTILAAKLAIEAKDYWTPSAQRSSLASAASDLLSLIGLGRASPQTPIKRRTIP